MRKHYITPAASYLLLKGYQPQNLTLFYKHLKADTNAGGTNGCYTSIQLIYCIPLWYGYFITHSEIKWRYTCIWNIFSLQQNELPVSFIWSHLLCVHNWSKISYCVGKKDIIVRKITWIPFLKRIFLKLYNLKSLFDDKETAIKFDFIAELNPV
jgi:hypothetical protein